MSCPNRGANGGCKMHNLHCGYPKCEGNANAQPAQSGSRTIAVPKSHVRDLVALWLDDGYVHMTEAQLAQFKACADFDGAWAMAYPALYPQQAELAKSKLPKAEVTA
jgi:hypothetical protein